MTLLHYRALLCLSVCLAASGRAQSAALPNAPSTFRPVLLASLSEASLSSSSAAPFANPSGFTFAPSPNPTPASQTSGTVPHHKPVPLDADGNPIPLERQQPARILGFMPNFRTVSAGAKSPPEGWKSNFTEATHQATDYSSFLFLGLTSLLAEGLDEHPALGKGPNGFYAYTWRGFLDKTDNTYLSAWFLPSLLHEDTRFYPLGNGHTVLHRELYVITRQAVTRNYDGKNTANIAGLGGKALTQVVSRSYYPASATDFESLSEKFGYSIMRDIIFSNIREFYPDIAAHYIRRHREKVAAQAALDAHTTP